MEEQVKDRLLDEVVGYAKTLEKFWEEHIVHRIGDEPETIELATQVRNGYYILGSDEYIEDPNITDEKYIEFVEKIHAKLSDNYQRLLAIKGNWKVVSQNPVPDFPLVIKNILQNSVPKTQFIVRCSRGSSTVEYDGNIIRLVNNIRTGAKILELLDSIQDNNVGYKLLRNKKEVVATLNRKRFIMEICRNYEM